ncbi:MAG: NADP-specific glutamate dehydrogenase [Sciscionella sp.]
MRFDDARLDRVYAAVADRSPGEQQFLAAVSEVFGSIGRLADRAEEYLDPALLETLCEPERQVIFRVPWEDDEGVLRVNRGFRVEFNSALGPYKGGLRFNPSVNADVVKSLGFEQVFKNALTGLAIGGGKGGSDFTPKGRSEHEIRRFCQSFMTELSRHIGPLTDVPAGDNGVGSREIGYLLGQYIRLTNSAGNGALTGKPVTVGGLAGRAEATGYGLVYFVERMLDAAGSKLAGATAVVSGAGAVSRPAIEKLTNAGARVLACSDTSGYVYEPDGIDVELLYSVKSERRGSLADYAEQRPSAEHRNKGSVWEVECEIALPCATQNELDAETARGLIDHGVRLVAEGANMPTTAQAVTMFTEAGVLFGPGKAANAGGVAVSAMEMRQNAQREQFSAQEIDESLSQIMREIHDSCAETAEEYGAPGDYLVGANIAGFLRVVRAMQALGQV